MKLQQFFPTAFQALMFNLNGHTKKYIIYNCEKKNTLKMNKSEHFMGKINYFFGSLYISPLPSSVTWLHVEAPPKNTNKINKYWLSTLDGSIYHLFNIWIYHVVYQHSINFLSSGYKSKPNHMLLSIVLLGASEPHGQSA